MLNLVVRRETARLLKLKRGCKASAIEWPVVRHGRDKRIKGCLFERVRHCALQVARRVQQLSQYVNFKINGFSSFFVIVEISKV
jgi:hypothetical protein